MAGEDAAKRKRPLGLKARAAKKASVEAGDAQQPAVKDFEESTATVMLQGDEASDEVDELEGIFNSAIECADEDVQRAVALLRGTIHESDRLLRQSDAAGQSMDARFYLIYGSALYSMTEVSDGSGDDDAATFLELARQRLAQAEALCGEGAEALLARVRLAQAKVELAMLAADEARGVPLEALNRAALALQLAPQDEQQQQGEGPVALVSLVLSLVDSQRVGDDAAAELVYWGEAQARELPASEDAKQVLAHALFLRTSALLERDELGAGTASLLTEAHGLLAGAETAAALLMRGEIELNLGNVQAEEADQERHYAAAVATFKRVQAMGELPDAFAQFVDDMDAPGSDGSDDSSDSGGSDDVCDSDDDE